MEFPRLFQKAKPAGSPSAKFPEGRVGFAVGDVHGRADLLVSMMELLEGRAGPDTRDGQAPVVVFLGDYVDRGPQSAAVLDLLKQRPAGFERRFLMGNHEQAMLAFMRDPIENRAWLMHGGTETLLAYGIQPPPTLGAEDAQIIEVGARLKEKLPGEHLAFLEGLERYAEYGDYAFVHAGLDPAKPLAEQTDADLFWIRQRFIGDRRPLSHRVVHGHTPVENPHADRRRIAIDTGAYASGVLTAARFEGETVSFLSVFDKAARARAETARRRR